ncbi:hypothetical protein, partial [Alicyclobacillus sp.]|uniref:hypothetical protein n=1 Tax=Alicyclobacillus sp. TaxID=61169 RepID=UPI0025C2B961
MKGLDRVQSWCSRLDARLVGFVRTHAHLFAATCALLLCVWGLTVRHVGFALGMVILGAVGYFIGLVVALGIGVVLTALDVYAAIHTDWVASTLLLEMVGYACIAWLGYSHRQQKERQKRMALEIHEPQVLPWSVVNEVRTSLAAIRFLLFPLHGDNNQEVRRATDELSRLERLFTEIEREEKAREREARERAAQEWGPS